MEDSYDKYKTYLQTLKAVRDTHKIQALKRIYIAQLRSPISDKLLCYEWASLAGGLLASYLQEVYIIETYNHAVLYDGVHTWDFSANAIFENYRYPTLNIRSPIAIWDDIAMHTPNLRLYYSKEVLKAASARSIGYKRIFKL